MGSSKDDVDRLFTCFKCGISPPQSAFRVRPRQQGKKLRVTPAAEGDGGGSSSTSASTRKAGGNASEHREPSSAAIKFRNRKQMSPVVFYGSPQGVPVKKPISLLRLLREIHIDLKKQTDLVSRDVVWATFPRQDEAIRFSKEHAHTKVFIYQDHLSGQRRFLVSTYDEFWRRYNNMDPQIRHHYEVIQEGSPCHIYFDLEFNAKLNQKRDADEMVDTLVAVTFSALQDKYSIEGQEEWIIELDSSNEEKFSRHLIIRIPKTAFKDNSHVGAFISENDKELFMESLICRLDDDCDKLLICKLDLECKKALHFDTEASVTRIQVKNCRVAIDTYRSDFPQAYTYGRSPFPALDGFIESIASFGSVSGKIRCWYWFSQDGLMIYSMSRSRYCEHIGREHKSNHVMYIVDFQRAAYYQKCYDPDCRGYRSPLRAVPLDVIPELTTSIAGSARRDYQGNVVEFNMEGGGNDANSVMGSGEEEEDPDWWEEAVKFADSVENVDHAPPASCNLEDGGCDDADWWTDVERFMVQMESQGDA
ncbi:uncharacterized protein LOC125535578 isoform X2 [Triticum urartu]|uniref:uncharacterized protein LOC125535578 isoform X2 n=1 Tax=Triticum urartu TaxID=4572 RepID=UPI0020442D27|nr:uncharacterized protein LOC125535578 isoform X2 [Triticum urartu]